MNKRDYLKRMSELMIEGCIELPIEEMESFDNTENIKHARFQIFQAKKSLFQERNRLFLEKASTKVKEKIALLAEKPIEKLQEMLLSRSPNMQFRNLDKLDKEELIKILGDYMLLEDIEDDNE